ncbi:MAG: 50S ribosomal protein L9 [Pseudomonadota bacterium]
MEIILLERVEKLGQMGDVVRVRPGYARNFLLPQKKALRATKANLAYFETQRQQLEARNLERKGEADTVAEKLNGQSFIIIRQAGEAGQLYGSVTIRDIADRATEEGFSVSRSQVVLNVPIKSLGVHDVQIKLHPEVTCTVQLNVARTDEEAERQARGEDVLLDRLAEDEEDALARADELFENDEDAEAAVAELDDGSEDSDQSSEDGVDET